MKKILFSTAIITLFTFYFSFSQAQRPHDEKHQARPDITELVSDLSSSQKSKIETLSNESKERVEKLRKQQHAIRDSIRLYMDREGNQSKHLYPLFDREAKLQAEISREMYATKVRIDEVLTKEQRAEFQKAIKKQRKHHGKKR